MSDTGLVKVRSEGRQRTAQCAQWFRVELRTREGEPSRMELESQVETGSVGPADIVNDFGLHSKSIGWS